MFAIKLRQLRAEAGFDAKTIDAIAAENYMPRSTLYAAMSGRRLPTVPVLAALVRAWGGNETEWLMLRLDTENALERLRLAAQQAKGVREETARLGDESGEVSMDRAMPDRLVDEHSAALQAFRSAPMPDVLQMLIAEAEEEEVNRIMERLRRRRTDCPDRGDVGDLSELERMPEQVVRAADLLEMLPQNVLFQELLRRGENAEPLWAALRARAGAPTLRTLQRSLWVSQGDLSDVLHGRSTNEGLQERVYRHLQSRIDDLTRERADDADPDAEQAEREPT
ncbi:hypothetical protein [Streptomyces werraensis]|uniref:hypothetical protein n=1 Tax=Streptomyces werraensis TaxID=68284 RepID=UPI0038188EDA